MHAIFAFATLAQTSDGGFLHAVPHDPATVFTMILIVIGAGAVLYYGSPRGGGNKSE